MKNFNFHLKKLPFPDVSMQCSAPLLVCTCICSCMWETGALSRQCTALPWACLIFLGKI